MSSVRSFSVQGVVSEGVSADSVQRIAAFSLSSSESEDSGVTLLLINGVPELCTILTKETEDTKLQDTSRVLVAKVDKDIVIAETRRMAVAEEQHSYFRLRVLHSDGSSDSDSESDSDSDSGSNFNYIDRTILIQLGAPALRDHYMGIKYANTDSGLRVDIVLHVLEGTEDSVASTNPNCLWRMRQSQKDRTFTLRPLQMDGVLVACTAKEVSQLKLVSSEVSQDFTHIFSTDSI